MSRPWARRVPWRSAHAGFPDGPDDPAGEEDEGHREGQVEIGVGPAEQGLLDVETFRGLMSPADGADAGNETHPVGGEDKDEDRGEEPERPLDQVGADDAFEQAVEALDQPLEKVLRPAGNLRHVPRRELAKRIRPRATIQVTTIELVIGEPERPADFDRALREAVLDGLRPIAKERRRRRRSCR